MVIDDHGLRGVNLEPVYACIQRYLFGVPGNWASCSSMPCSSRERSECFQMRRLEQLSRGDLVPGSLTPLPGAAGRGIYRGGPHGDVD